LAILLGLATAMGGCSSRDDGQWRVCTDAWARRLPDIACQQSNTNGGGYGHYGGGGGGWVFINRSSSAPPVGQIVTGGMRSASGSIYSAPAQGITRGGFGGIGERLGMGHGVGE
jgi:hypothetical protein